MAMGQKRHGSATPRCRLWVKMRSTRKEQMFSACRPTADIRHGISKV
jgi:hypothetical protein